MVGSSSADCRGERTGSAGWCWDRNVPGRQFAETSDSVDRGGEKTGRGGSRGRTGQAGQREGRTGPVGMREMGSALVDQTGMGTGWTGQRVAENGQAGQKIGPAGKGTDRAGGQRGKTGLADPPLR